jgi:hypothetical protein
MPQCTSTHNNLKREKKKLKKSRIGKALETESRLVVLEGKANGE